MTTSATLPESLEIPDATKLPLPDRQLRHRRCTSACVICLLLAVVDGDRPASARPSACGCAPSASTSWRRVAPACRSARDRRWRWPSPARSVAWPAPSCCKASSTPEDRLLLGLRLRRPGGRPAVARLDAGRAGRRAVLRLPALGRHLHGDHGRRAGGADAGHPGPDRHRRRGLGDPGRQAARKPR